MTQLASATVRHFIPLVVLLILLLITVRDIRAEVAGHDDRKQAAVIEHAEGKVTRINDTDSAGRTGTTDNAFRQPARNLSFNETLDKNIVSLLTKKPETFDTIPEQRKKKLDGLAAFISKNRTPAEPVKLVFICTHNSRRSHIAQIWTATAAAYYGVSDVLTYSGGTEATDFNARAVAALRGIGFSIKQLTSSDSPPHYQVSFSRYLPDMTVFSKKYDDPLNPGKGFVAIMTCSHADKTCPDISGASLRIALPWVDPKEADGTTEEASRYDERVRQIGSEMLYLFARVKG